MPGPKITITIDDSKLRQMIAETAGPIKPKVVADGVEYGIYQEYGVENGFGRGIRIPAHPFMRPAVEAVRGQFNKAMRAALGTGKAQAVVDKTAFDVEKIAKSKAPVDTGALKNSIHVVDGDKFTTTFEKQNVWIEIK